MALINDIYIFVETESVSVEVDSTTHPVEKGIDLTDNIKRKPVSCSLTGKCVDYGGVKASQALAQLKQLELSGSIVKYIGRNILNNMQIKKIDTDHPNTVAGGCEFSIDLEEIRIAQNSYTEPTEVKDETSAGTQQVTQGTGNAVYYTLTDAENIYKIAGAYQDLHKGQSKDAIIKFIRENNPDIFTGEYKTFTPTSGTKILVGYKDETKESE